MLRRKALERVIPISALGWLGWPSSYGYLSAGGCMYVLLLYPIPLLISLLWMSFL